MRVQHRLQVRLRLGLGPRLGPIPNWTNVSLSLSLRLLSLRLSFDPLICVFSLGLLRLCLLYTH